MMKDTVSDMRKHIWNRDEPESQNGRDKILEEAEKKAEDKVEEVKKIMDRKLSEILDRQKISEGNVSDIQSEMERLLENAIQRSRQIDSEARDETVRNHILSELQKSIIIGKTLTASELIDSLHNIIPPNRIIEEIERLKEDGMVLYRGGLGPNTKIRLPAHNN